MITEIISNFSKNIQNIYIYITYFHISEINTNKICTVLYSQFNISIH